MLVMIRKVKRENGVFLEGNRFWESMDLFCCIICDLYIILFYHKNIKLALIYLKKNRNFNGLLFNTYSYFSSSQLSIFVRREFYVKI